MTRPGLVLVLALCWTVSVSEIVRVIDGDTFVARLEIWPELTATETVRILGVDTPERTGVTRPAGEAAKAFTDRWLADHRGSLTLWACQRDAFGRLLGGVTADGASLTKALLEAGHGRVR